MINIRTLTPRDIGRYVVYTDGVGNKEIGRLKSWNNMWLFVVYHCADKWDNFTDYTAAATAQEDLEWQIE